MKNNLKRFLTLLLVVMLSLSLVVFAACNPDEDTPAPDGGSGTEDSALKLTVTNGNFATTSTTIAPMTPSSWSSVSSSSTTPVKGVISVDADTYASYATTYAVENDPDTAKRWFSKPNPGKATSDVKGLADDNNVLMLYNGDAGYSGYSSSSALSIAANTNYRLDVSVKTTDITVADTGAKIYIYGSNSCFYEITNINTAGEWKTYSIYIQGNNAASKSIYVYLTLGANNKATAAGVAYFDNVHLTTIEDEAFDYDTVDVSSAYAHKTSLTQPNPEFDFLTFSSAGTSNVPALYTTTNTGNGNYINRRVNTEAAAFEAAKLSYGANVVNPGTAPGTVGTNVYMLHNTQLSGVGITTATGSNYFYTFKQCRYYKLSVWVKTVAADPSQPNDATLMMKSEDDSFKLTANTNGVTDNNGWALYSFYIVSNKNISTAMNFQFHLGTGEDSSTWSSGWAFIDGLKLESISAADMISADDAYNKIVNLRTDEASLLENGLFTQGKTGYTPVFDEGTTDTVSGINVSDVKAGIWDTANDTNEIANLIGSENSTISGFDKPALPYDANTDSLLAIVSNNPVVYKVKYVDNGMTLQPYKYYRLGVWVKTVDIQSTSGAYVTLFNDEDTSLSSFTAINTESITTDLIEGWQELAFYIQTGADAETVYLNLGMGTGTKWTSTTLAKGAAYMCNLTLTEVDYADYNGGSSTYAKKASFITSTNATLTNGYFDNYDYSKVTGLTAGGNDSEGNLSDDFGTVSGWTLTNENKNGEQLHGIVDQSRTDGLMQNLVNKIGNASILDTANLSNVFIDPTLTTDLDELSYYGGNKYLLLASTAVKTNTAADDNKAVALGYKTFSAITLSSGSCYEISVMVKTINTATASIYLMGSDNNVLESFNAVSTSAVTDHNGWTRYSFYVETGLNTQSVYLALYLGEKGVKSDVDADAAATASYTLNGGAVLFDSAYYQTVEKQELDSATGATVLKHSFTTNSFEDFAASTSTSATLTTPEGWTGKDTSATDENDTTVYTRAGIISAANRSAWLDSILGLASFTEPAAEEPDGTIFYKNTGTTDAPVWEIWVDGDSEDNKYVNATLTGDVTLATQYARKAVLEAALVGNGSDSALLINNYEPTAYTYTSSETTLIKDSYYKITFTYKLFEVTGGKAFAKLYISTTEEYVFELTATDWTTLTFFVKTPSSDAKVSLVYGLGSVDTDAAGNSVNNYSSGFAMFDDIAYETVTALQYNSANDAATVKKAPLVSQEQLPEDPEDPETPEEEPKRDLGWLVITSVVLGAVMVIVVVIYFIKKWREKHKRIPLAKRDAYDARNKGTPDSVKSKDDKYKGMKD